MVFLINIAFFSFINVFRLLIKVVIILLRVFLLLPPFIGRPTHFPGRVDQLVFLVLGGDAGGPFLDELSVLPGQVLALRALLYLSQLWCVTQRREESAAEEVSLRVEGRVAAHCWLLAHRMHWLRFRVRVL